MADISKIVVPSGDEYDIKDSTSRSGLADKMDKTNPTGTGSFSLNRQSGTSIGANSFAEGNDTTASGNSSHAEGNGTIATAFSSHAEGYATTASGRTSHAEGQATSATGFSSHTEGAGTTASAYYSHAEGLHTTANHKSQHVFGEYNVLDDSTAAIDARGNYVEIVGNGASNSPSNARTLDWSGNEVLSGTIEASGFGTTLDKEVDRGGVQLTQAQYDALVNAGTVDANTTYFITDANNTTASYAAGVTYDNTDSGLTATNVQDAIDEVAQLGSLVQSDLTSVASLVWTLRAKKNIKHGICYIDILGGTNGFSENQTIFSGAPIPETGYPANLIGLCENAFYRFYVDTQGNVNCRNPIVASNAEFSVFGSYFTAD